MRAAIPKQNKRKQRFNAINANKRRKIDEVILPNEIRVVNSRVLGIANSNITERQYAVHEIYWQIHGDREVKIIQRFLTFKDNESISLSETTNDTKQSPLRSFYILSLLPIVIPEFNVPSPTQKTSARIKYVFTVSLTSIEFEEILQTCRYFNSITIIQKFKKDGYESDNMPLDSEHLLFYPKFTSNGMEFSDIVSFEELKAHAGYDASFFKQEMLLSDLIQHEISNTVYKTPFELVQAVNSENSIDAKRISEEISTKIAGTVVITNYNKKTYVVDHIASKHASSIMESLNIPYSEYYKEQYGIELTSTSIFVHAFRTIARKEWEYEESDTSSMYLVANLCYVTQFSPCISTHLSFLNYILDHVSHCLNHYFLLEELQAQIQYSFSDKSLLRTAFTHMSYCTMIESGKSSNERLEFLGDSVLDIIITQYVFETYKHVNEGKMTDLRTSIVRNSNLQRIAKELGLDGYLLHPQLQTIEDSALSDVCEALIGAIFIDGDLQAAKSFITKFVLPHDVQTDHEHQFHSFELPYYAKVPLSREVEDVILKVEEQIGVTFNNKFLLLQAIIHPTYNISNIFTFDDESLKFNYERIEFLGDSILKFVVGNHLYINFPHASEGAMTLTRHATVDNDISLVAASEALDIMKFTKHQIDTNNHTLNKGSPMYRKFAADVFEALVGAIYLDQGGFYATKHRVYDIFGAFIQKFLFSIRECDPTKVKVHFKNELQEQLQSLLASATIPKYNERERLLTTVDVWYITTDVMLFDTLLATGEGNSKKESEAEAAKKALRVISQIKKQYDRKITQEEFRIAYQQFSKSVSDLQTTSSVEVKRKLMIADYEHVTVNAQKDEQAEKDLEAKIHHLLSMRK